MREAYELGFLAAFLQGDGSFPNLYYLDDVTFYKPVEIGSLTKFVGSFFSFGWFYLNFGFGKQRESRALERRSAMST